MKPPGPRPNHGPQPAWKRVLFAPAALLRALFIELPRSILFHLRVMPPLLRYSILAIVLTGIGTGGYFVYDKFWTQRDARMVLVLWQQFEFEAGKQDAEAMESK